jgi:hypothetical protein
MPKLIWVWVVGEDAPQKGEAPNLWTAELQQAASGPVVKRQLSVWPWKADGKYAKAVDIWGKTWQAHAAGWMSPRPTKADLSEDAYRQTSNGRRKRPTLAKVGEEAYRQTSNGRRKQPTLAKLGEEAYRQTSIGQRSATESARLLAARGAGETEDGLTEGEREALAEHVAAEEFGREAIGSERRPTVMRITVELVEVTRSFGLTGASQASELDKIRYQSDLILSEPSKKPYSSIR